MRVLIHNHNGRADRLITALQSRGHTAGDNVMAPDLMLIDHDGTDWYRSIINQAQRVNVPVWLYSHGAMSCMAWDGWWEPHPHTSGYLANGTGDRDIMRLYGYTKPVHVVGYYWSDIKPTEPTAGEQVLFAPIHPLNNGFIRPEALRDNRAAFRSLLNVPDIKLKVRHLFSLEANGLWIEEGVEYEQAPGDGPLASIQQADVVVSWGTFAHLAIASGKPTVMYSQGNIPGDGHAPDDMRYAKSFEKYRHILQYPLDLFELGPSALKLAASGIVRIERWYDDFIGRPLDPSRFSSLLEGFIDA